MRSAGVPNIIDWPASLRPRGGAGFTLNERSRSGGMSLSGIEQVIGTGAAAWTYEASIDLRSRSSILAFRGLIAALDGRAGVVRVTHCDMDRSPRFVSGLGASLGSTFSTGATFATGARFGNTRASMPVNSAAAGATTITATIPTSWILVPGHRIGIAEGLYEVRSVSRVDTTVTLTIRPGLRAAIGAGAYIVLDKPSCLMRLDADAASRVELDLGRFGAASVRMTEALGAVREFSTTAGVGSIVLSYQALIGGGQNITVMHNLNTLKINTELVEFATGASVGAGIIVIDANSIRVDFGATVAANAYRITVLGAA
jgi:hypothetical protein